MSHLEIHCNLACFLDFQILNIFHHTIVNATYIHSYLGTLTWDFYTVCNIFPTLFMSHLLPKFSKAANLFEIFT